MTATPLTPAESPPRIAGAVSALLLGEADQLDPRALDSLLEQLAGRPASATIVCVAPRPLLIHYWAPVTGLITLERMRAMSIASASEAARRLAASLPEGMCVRHQVARSWAEALRLVGGHDVVVVSGRPRCRRDRRQATYALRGM